MKLVSNETSLVIAGTWNLGILTPKWVLKHGLEKPEDQSNQVQVFIPATQSASFEFPRYVLDDLSFSVLPDMLIMSPLEVTDKCMKDLEDTLTRMLKELKHTPVTGIGHNFIFREEHPDPQALNIFTSSRQDLADCIPNNWQPASDTLSATFKNPAETTFINIQRQLEANALIIKFNFHHPIKLISEASNVLKGKNGYSRMPNNLQLARKLMEELYGKLEND